MPRKRPIPFIPGPELLRFWGLVIAAVAAAGLVVAGGWALLFRSPVFVVHSVVVPKEGLGTAAAELERLRGTRIFSVDLDRVAARIQARNPGLADLRVLRRLPDELVVRGRWRSAEALVLAGGRRLAVAADGVLILPPEGDAAAGLAVIRGLSVPRAVPGVELGGPGLEAALQVVAAFRGDRTLAAFGLREVDVGTSGRIECRIGPEDGQVDVVMEQGQIQAKLRTLAAIIARGDARSEEIRYIDLRFPEPVFGKKKARP